MEDKNKILQVVFRPSLFLLNKLNFENALEGNFQILWVLKLKNITKYQQKLLLWRRRKRAKYE